MTRGLAGGVGWRFGVYNHVMHTVRAPGIALPDTLRADFLKNEGALRKDNFLRLSNVSLKEEPYAFSLVCSCSVSASVWFQFLVQRPLSYTYSSERETSCENWQFTRAEFCVVYKDGDYEHTDLSSFDGPSRHQRNVFHMGAYFTPASCLGNRKREIELVKIERKLEIIIE